MTTITEAVEGLKDAALKLREARKKLITVDKELKTVKEQESDARKKYAVALGELEKLTGGYS